MGIQFYQHHILKRTALSPCNSCLLCCKLIGCICLGLFLTLYLFTLIYVPLCMAIPYIFCLMLLFSCEVLSDSLNPMLSSTLGFPVHHYLPVFFSNSCPLSSRCHPTTSSSVVLFCSSPQSFLVSGSFPVSQLFVSGGESIGAATSASVLPMNIQD